MMRRLSILVRGPGVLIAVFVVVAALGARGHDTSASDAHGSRATPTAKPTASPQPRPVYRLGATGAGSFLDRATGTSATVEQFALREAAGSTPSSLEMNIDVTLINRSHRVVHVSPSNFFLLAQSGITYGEITPNAENPALTRESLLGGSATSGWIQFNIASRASVLTLYWSDDDHLLIPVVLQHFTVRRVS